MKQTFHPRAFLTLRRNVRSGLAARSRILMVLEQQAPETKVIVNSSGLNYRVVVYHLRLLETEHVVLRKGVRKPFVWELTGVGQQRLTNASVLK